MKLNQGLEREIRDKGKKNVTKMNKLSHFDAKKLI